MSIPSPIVLYNLSDATMKGLLPAGYTPLAYVESTGTLWIDTGTTINGTVYTQGKIMPVNISGERDWIGNYNNSTSGGFVVGLYNSKHYSFSSNGGATNNGAIEANVIYKHYALFTSSSGNLIANGITYSGSARTVTPNNTVTLFRRGDANCYWYGRVYFARLWQDNILKGDWRPSRRDSDGVIGMYDLVSRTFKTNSGSGTFIAGPPLAVGKGGGKSLPEEYLLVEYIRIPGGGGINTGVTVTSGTKFVAEHVMTFQQLSSNSRDTSGYNGNASGYWEVGNGNKYGTYNVGSIVAGTRDKIVFTKTAADGGNLVVNGTISHSCGDGHTGTYTIGGVNGSYSGSRWKDVEYIKIWSADVLVRNMYACYRKSDMKPGMYDVVNGAFYTNAGSGEFILGPTITNVYTYEPNANINHVLIPSTYQQVEYLESNGSSTSSYITFTNRGLLANDNVQIDASILRVDNNLLPSIFGWSGVAQVYFPSRVLSYWLSSYVEAISPAAGTTITLNAWYSFKFKIKSTLSSWNLFTYASNYYPANAKLGKVVIIRGSSMIMQLVPCYRKSDNKPGMYDTVTNMFYTNSGSGEFTLGPNIYCNEGLCTNLSTIYDSSKGWVADFSTSSVEMPGLLTLLGSSTDFSFAIWFKRSSGGGLNTIWGCNGFELEAARSGNNQVVAYNWGQSSSGGITYTLGEWHHLVMTRNTSESKFYLDGELKYTGSPHNIPNTALFLGAWKEHGFQSYLGLMTNMMLFNVVLTADLIKELYGK